MKWICNLCFKFVDEDYGKNYGGIIHAPNFCVIAAPLRPETLNPQKMLMQELKDTNKTGQDQDKDKDKDKARQRQLKTRKNNTKQKLRLVFAG
jgi:hypothetical protein